MVGCLRETQELLYLERHKSFWERDTKKIDNLLYKEERLIKAIKDYTRRIESLKNNKKIKNGK